MTDRGRAGRTHVVGGGMAGLSAALTLAEAGRAVVLHEAGPGLGGRCRSYHDRSLDCRLDNGNHLLLSGNDEVFSYLRRIGSADSMLDPGEAMFPFVDLGSGARWTVRINRGRIPWWLLDRDRRVPGVRPRSYFSLLRLLRAGPDETVAGAVPAGPLRERLLDPLAIAILNTMPGEGSARLLADTFRASLLRGGRACVPTFPRVGLSESFVDPAIGRLRALGAEIRLSSRIARLEPDGGAVARLAGPDGDVTLGGDDRVVLATPAPVAASLVPGLTVPDRFESIANLHFRTGLETAVASIRQARFVGLIGGLSEWVFTKPGIVSVTISAANRFEDEPADTLVARVWHEVIAALGLPTDAIMPQSRLVREKRATFAATPAQDTRRPGAETAWNNLVLAGDWTATGLPATIEGAIKSGRTAAERVLRTG